MAEANAPSSVPSESQEFAPVLDMYSFYGYGKDVNGMPYQTADEAWSAEPARPSWMQEPGYEFDNLTGKFKATSWETRRSRFWAVLAGGHGQRRLGLSGHLAPRRHPEVAEHGGSDRIDGGVPTVCHDPWRRLSPSGTGREKAGRNLVVDGAATWGDVDYVMSALTLDGAWLLAYLPVTEQGQRTISIDMLSGPVPARWCDPGDGNYLAIEEQLPNTGTRAFPTPGKRDDGTDDWLLVLDTAGPSPCGSITSAGLYTAPSVVPTNTCYVTATSAKDPSYFVRTPISVRG